jgi:hypothetical protein
MNLYSKLENFINKYPTKIRVYLSTIFMLFLMYQIKDTNIITSEIAIYLYVLAPIIIYYFVTLIFNNGKDS